LFAIINNTNERSACCVLPKKESLKIFVSRLSQFINLFKSVFVFFFSKNQHVDSLFVFTVFTVCKKTEEAVSTLLKVNLH